MASERHLRIDYLQLDLLPSGAQQLAVYALEARLSPDGLVALAREALAQAGSRLPIEVELAGARFVPGGAELSVRAKRFGVGMSVSARLAIAATDDGLVRVTVTDFPGFLGPLVEAAFGRVDRIRGLKRTGNRAVDVDPAALLADQGVPIDWRARVAEVATTAEALTVRCTTR